MSVHLDPSNIVVRVVHIQGLVLYVQPVDVTSGWAVHSSLCLVARQFMDTYQQLQEDIQTSPPVIRPSLGMAVAVKCAEIWNRGLVMEIGSQVKVKLVDWGLEEHVEMRKLRMLPENLVDSSPVQCIHIGMAEKDLEQVSVQDILVMDVTFGEGLVGHVVGKVKHKDNVS